MRNAVVAGVAFAGNVCTTLNPAIYIVTYPFMDLNFATGLHNLVNAVLFLLVQIPDNGGHDLPLLPAVRR